jgi:hypothetical protein
MSQNHLWNVFLCDLATHASALVGTLVGSAVALCGVLIANANNRKLSHESREHENRSRFHDQRLTVAADVLSGIRTHASNRLMLTTVPVADAARFEEIVKRCIDGSHKVLLGVMTLEMLGPPKVAQAGRDLIQALQEVPHPRGVVDEEVLDEKVSTLLEAVAVLQEALRAELSGKGGGIAA